MTSSSPSKILILGATGQIGRYITDAIVNAQPAFDQITVFTSKDATGKKAEYIEKLKQKGVKFFFGDVSSEEDIKAAYAEGADTVVSALGRDVIAKQIELIRFAEESSTVRWFFPSEYGTDIEFGPASADEKPHQQKLKVRKYVRENIQRLKVTYVVTGPYIDMFVNLSAVAPEAGGFDITNKKAVLVEDGEGKIGFTTMPE